MGPSSRAASSRAENRWLRRQDSNLQSPDPESGALPIWPLLSAAPQNITNGSRPRHLGSELRGKNRIVRNLLKTCKQESGIAESLNDYRQESHPFVAHHSHEQV